jgi:hypothetical protein
MRPLLPVLILATLLGLGGCAAALVYDRPAGTCRDTQKNCPQSAVPDRPAIGSNDDLIYV